MLKTNVDNMKTIVKKILSCAGCHPTEASVVAAHLVEANLMGHDSHGIGMVPIYVANMAEGTLVPNQDWAKVREDGGILVADGRRGFGQRIAAEVMAEAIEKCRRNGTALAALRNVHHVGRVGTYGEQAIASGLVSIHFVNVVGFGRIAPHAGTDGRLGTNPICIAIPGSVKLDPVLLDMATSKVAVGKVRVALEAGVPVGEGNLLDPKGRPTTDPAVMFDRPPGALLPVGSYKGYGIALCCEILAGILCGGGTVESIDGKTGGVVNNMLTLLVDPERLVDLNWMHREIETIVEHVKASPPADSGMPVRVAGDPEREKSALRKAQGIPLSSSSWQALCKAAEKVGIPAEEMEAMRQKG
jgi:uncharacterized oxidoreductase